ncbi:peptidase inhibitor family I36 protein [Streptomyces niveus]
MTVQGNARSSAAGRIVVAMMVTFFAFAATTGSAGASADGGRPDFSAQARGLGLTSSQAETLQARADGYLARTGGAQVAVNRIELQAGAVLLLALPGEKYARDLTGKSGARTATYCPYDWMCAYSGTGYSGDQINMYYCNLRYGIPWYGDGSWHNNQSAGTRAEFFDTNGNLGWTSPGAESWDDVAPWGWVGSISPC